MTLISGNSSRDPPPCIAGTEITTKLLLLLLPLLLMMLLLQPLLLMLLLLLMMMMPMLRLITNPRHINIVLSGVTEYLSCVSISCLKKLHRLRCFQCSLITPK